MTTHDFFIWWIVIWLVLIGAIGISVVEAAAQRARGQSRRLTFGYWLGYGIVTLIFTGFAAFVGTWIIVGLFELVNAVLR